MQHYAFIFRQQMIHIIIHCSQERAVIAGFELYDGLFDMVTDG